MIPFVLAVALAVGLGLCLHEFAGILTNTILVALAKKRIERKYKKIKKGENE